MFKTLHESFEDPNIRDLNNNIVRFQSLESNYSIFNNQYDYQYPNAGPQTQQRQASNVALQNALNTLGTVPVPTSSRGQREPTDITNIPQVLTGIPDTLNQKLKACRKFEGLVGLSNLMKTQNDPSITERCGWRYKPGAGVIPEVAQGAYGKSSGPMDPAVPRVDRIGNGTNYIWDLKTAEKQMVNDICKAATSCMDMTAVPISAVGDFSNICGYCETSKKIIPIKTVNGAPFPRYNDVDSQCASNKIITVADAKQRCQPPNPNEPQAAYWKCLNADKLDRDCVVLSTYFSGCSPEGTLIQALAGGKNDSDYASLLRGQKAFQKYQELSQTPLSESVIRQGNTNIFAAFMNTYNLNRNMYNSDNEKRWVAALDLCRYGGIYEQWNFCSDLKDSDKDYDVKCMQQYFLKSGGYYQGAAFPRQENFQQFKGNKTWRQYKNSVDDLKNRSRSTNPRVQNEAAKLFFGIDTGYNPTALPRNSSTRGVEVFYIDMARNVFLGRRPYLSEDGKNIPNFDVGSGEVDGTGLRDNVLIEYIHELRPDNDMTLSFGVVTDDGWAISRNRNVHFYIPDGNERAAWWYDQAPTWHNTVGFPISAESKQRPNIIYGVWYERGGGAVLRPYYRIGNAQFNRSGQSGWNEITARDNFWKNNCYLTQEIDAPTLQFEPYQHRNYWSPGLQFSDRRLYAMYPLREANHAQTAQQKGIWFWKVPASGHLFSQMKDQHVMVLRTNQSWSINGSIAGSAIRTWTILFHVEQLGNGYFDLFLADNKGGGPRNFAVQATKYGNNGVQLTLIHSGWRGTVRAAPIIINKNEWNMAVIRLHPESASSQYSQRAIKKLSFFVQSWKNMSKGTILNGTNYVEIVAGDHDHIFYDVAGDRRDTYRLLIGTGSTGNEKMVHYAWVHGFDDVIETSDVESWKKEANKTWRGRWFE